MTKGDRQDIWFRNDSLNKWFREWAESFGKNVDEEERSAACIEVALDAVARIPKKDLGNFFAALRRRYPECIGPP